LNVEASGDWLATAGTQTPERVILLTFLAMKERLEPSLWLIIVFHNSYFGICLAGNLKCVSVLNYRTIAVPEGHLLQPSESKQEKLINIM
jgi:hypothetical protein